MRATLDGIGLPVEPAAGWALTYGTNPYSRIFEVPTPVAVRLVKGARLRGSTLVLRAERRAPVTIKGLTIYGPGPGTRPGKSTLRVVDPRAFLRDAHVRLVANVRTRTGDRRRVGDGPLAVAQLSDDEAYRRWSVGPGGKPLTAADIIAQVLAQVDPTARLVLGDSLDEGTRGALQEIPEDVLIDDRGDVAIARALGYAGGGLDLFVAEDGILTVGPRLDGSERPLFGVPRDAKGTRVRGSSSPLGAWVVGAPGWALIDRSRERPARYRVLFDRRLEIRLDFAGDDDEGDFSTSTTTAQAAPDPPLTLTNVLPIPEHTLTAGGRPVTQGTFVPIKTYLTAKAGTWVPAEVGNLDLAAIRRCWLSSGLQEYADPTYDEGGLAARAIGAIRQHYHAGFQLARTLRERLVDIEASLTSIVDPKSGTRADSPVYADHAIWLSWRAAFQERARGLKGDALVRNFYANGTEAAGAIAALPITSLRRAPARVAVVDQDLGVLRVTFSIDATGEQVTLVHSALDAGKVPSTDPTQRDVLLQWGELASEHRLATIITAGLASPTTADGLHVVEVESPALMGELGASHTACTGPVRTLRVPGTIVAANFGWDDARAGEIRSVIGGTVKPDTIASCLLNGILLQIVAKAAAKADLATLLDRVDGSLTTALAPAGPAGGATVEHEVSRAGAKTTVACAGDQPAPPFEAFIPESVRKGLFRRLP